MNTSINPIFHTITNDAGYVNPMRVISNGNRDALLDGVRENLVTAYDSLTADSEALEASSYLMRVRAPRALAL